MPRNISIILFLSSIFLLSSCKKINDSPDQDANFSDEYISWHENRYFIEIPMVYELANVIMAIEYQNSQYHYFIQKNTSYYQTVIDYFSPFKSSDIFSKFTYSESDFNFNYSFRENSYKYTFENDRIISKNIYIKKYWEPNRFEEHLSEIQNLSDESDFTGFYSENNDYYKSQIELFDSIIPVEDIWNWLEYEFSAKYDCYKILISPLTCGSHSTQRYETDNYKETIMFVSGIHKEVDSFDTINILLKIRNLFTEIDHNYVNPVTKKHIDELNNSMKDLTIWKKETPINALYKDAYDIFNEYMTWALYDIYVKEKYSDNYFQLIREITNDKMINDRGFVKFNEFENYLIDLFIAKSENEIIEDLYPQILEWMKGIN